MTFDIFLSICQTEVDGYTPTERQMFSNFYSQAELADALGFGTAWVAETHLSCQVQKKNPEGVIPHFRGEIGLNTDILQTAHTLMNRTRHIHVGSAIRNILCNGGPIAHAEAVRTFLSLQSQQSYADRVLQLGFAAGRFPFSNIPYGIRPRNSFESSIWEILKGEIFTQGAEIFLRFLKGESFSSNAVGPLHLSAELFKNWREVYDLAQVELLSPSPAKNDGVSGLQGPTLLEVDDRGLKISSFFQFGEVGVIPFESSLENLRLTIGSHDPKTQIRANEILPVGVFNLSITPPDVIEETHRRMEKHFHPAGGPWRRDLMPRTVLVFIDENPARAKEAAEKAWRNYWVAMEKTLDPRKVSTAVTNAIAGHPEEVAEAIATKYHSEDRLMLWFDFNNHDNTAVQNEMKLFMNKVAPLLPGGKSWE